MAEFTGPCVYFEKPGRHNTERVVEVVRQRLERGDIGTVVVASTTGYTARCFADALQGRAGVRLISVAEGALIREWGTDYPSLKPETKRDLEARGVVVADHVSYLLHNSLFDYSQWKVPTPEQIVTETLYAFGQGFKVAIEVVLIAVANGLLEPFQDVIGVGGSSRGADTAAVMRATYPNHFFSQDAAKRFRVREVLCKPW